MLRRQLELGLRQLRTTTEEGKGGRVRELSCKRDEFLRRVILTSFWSSFDWSFLSLWNLSWHLGFRHDLGNLGFGLWLKDLEVKKGGIGGRSECVLRNSEVKARNERC